MNLRSIVYTSQIYFLKNEMFYIFTDTENLLTLNAISDNKNVNGTNIIIALIR